MRTFLNMLKAKFAGRSGQAGESITEVLVAMTVAGLALVMLAMAITSAFNIVSNSGTVATTYYAGNNALASPSSSSSAQMTVTGGPDSATSPSATISVNYTDASSSTPGSDVIVSYKAAGLAGKSGS